MICAYMICLLFTSSAAAFGYDMCPKERIVRQASSKSLLVARSTDIELVETDKKKLPLSEITLTKLAALRNQFDASNKNKPIIPQDFTTVEIQHLFATEWAYPDNKRSPSKYT